METCPLIPTRKISKLINKVSENVAKIDSIRFSCEKNSTNTMKAYVFPGQGSQFSGMGKDLYESN